MNEYSFITAIIVSSVCFSLVFRPFSKTEPGLIGKMAYKEKDQSKHDKIIEAAIKVFAKKGFYNAKVSEIAREANVADGTIYLYFKNKDDIFISLLQSAYDEWQASIAQEMEGVDVSSIPPREYVKFRIRNSLSYFAKDPELSNLVLRMGHGLPANLVQVIDRLDKEIISQIGVELRWGVKHRMLRKDLDVELAANVVHGAIIRVAYHYFVKKKEGRKPEQIDVLVDEIFDILTPGMFLP